MKFLKLDGLQIINKNAQKSIMGKGGDRCSQAAKGARMSACMLAGGQSSQACYDQSFGYLSGC